MKLVDYSVLTSVKADYKVQEPLLPSTELKSVKKPNWKSKIIDFESLFAKILHSAIVSSCCFL